MPHGGKRDGAGRKAGIVLPALADKECAGKLLLALNRPAQPDDPYEVQQWRKLVEAKDPRVSLDARKYLYDKRDGKAVQPMSGPIQNEPITMKIEHIGASEEFFAKQAEILGLK
jgi:hypothetical protein